MEGCAGQRSTEDGGSPPTWGFGDRRQSVFHRERRLQSRVVSSARGAGAQPVVPAQCRSHAVQGCSGTRFSLLALISCQHPLSLEEV